MAAATTVLTTLGRSRHTIAAAGFLWKAVGNPSDSTVAPAQASYAHDNDNIIIVIT